MWRGIWSRWDISSVSFMMIGGMGVTVHFFWMACHPVLKLIHLYEPYRFMAVSRVMGGVVKSSFSFDSWGYSCKSAYMENHMYICISLRPRIVCLSYEVVGFQPQTAAIPDLDSVFPLELFKPNNKVWQETISKERELYKTRIQHTYTNGG